MKKRIGAILCAVLILITSVPVFADNTSSRDVRILFTHDIHSYLDDAPKLASLISKKAADVGGTNYVYLDAGDFSQGTLYQSGYETAAYELGLLSMLGCKAACPGNHEWDHAGSGFANMLNVAREKYNPLPAVLCANIDFSGELNEEQTYVKETLESYNKSARALNDRYTIIEIANGLKLGVFGLSGISSIEDSPTSGMKWINYIDAAKEIVSELKGNCDVIIALSHCGTSGDGENGEDIELAKAVPGINLIISGHSHTAYSKPVMVGNTLIASAGCYMENLGCVDLSVTPFGSVNFSNYELVDLDNVVTEASYAIDYLNECKKDIASTYLASYGYEADEVLATLDYDFVSLDDMYATHEEYPMGNLIADSYIYEANKNGINDIDVALVGLGTIRGSFTAGDITVADAFEICSLGVGKDGSAGHPVLAAYISGQELKLLVQLDSSLGPLVSSIKMSYSGLRYEFNTKRMLLDRAHDIRLHNEFTGEEKEIEDDKLYKVCCNMYAANMLGMLNGLTKGLLKIEPKDANGNPITNFYDYELKMENGSEMKEWVAFADYLSSFPKNEDGISQLPDRYETAEGRKVKTAEGGLAVIAHPGTATWLAGGAILFVLILILLIVLLIRRIVLLIKNKR